ncbi:MAG: recombinase family protein [Alphaproteobacteria bacterium]|nr:recombinase family protein [Alphaproteobacteria bacterium]
MKQYFAYIRVSTVKQGEHGSSLQEQRSAIEAYASRNSLSIVAWFEETETAAKQGRTHFTKMLAQLERGIAQGVIIHKIDRSARNLKDWANLGDLIDRGIDVHFAHDSVDLRSRGGRLSADIQAVVAADYIRNLRDEVKKGYYGRLKQGLFPLPAPIGYVDQGKGKPKIPDPIKAPLVREAFELYATGTVGLKDLRVEMAKRGLTSTRTKKPLSLCGISTMLNNPFYIGLIHIKRTNETYNGIHEPLISKALFDRVQAILRGKLVARVFKHDYLFRRMVRCTACGYHLIGERHKGQYIYYRCHQCPNLYIREEDLDHAVQIQLQLLQWDEREELRAKEEAVIMAGEGEAELARLRSSLKLRLAQCDDRLSRLTDAYIDQTIDKELFENRKRAVLGERRELLDRLETLSTDDLPVKMAFDHLELGNAAYYGYKNGNRDEKRGMVEAVTSNFVAEGKKPVITLKSPWREVAKWRVSLKGAPHRGTPRDRAKQLLNIALAVAKESKNTSIAKKKVA